MDARPVSSDCDRNRQTVTEGSMESRLDRLQEQTDRICDKLEEIQDLRLMIWTFGVLSGDRPVEASTDVS